MAESLALLFTAILSHHLFCLRLFIYLSAMEALPGYFLLASGLILIESIRLHSRCSFLFAYFVFLFMVSSILFSRVLKMMLNISKDTGGKTAVCTKTLNDFIFHITPVNSAKL